MAPGEFVPTLRQKEVLSLLVEGFSDGEIAAALWISARTVRHHIAELRILLGARNRTHLVSRAYVLGVLA
ncbi:helix-turn-helix transcriptional regulator [Lentzea alba]|uniref:helix-turn-helix domain-containing protein n=1 Tax=Lentzea alba TaxID=2714351 RepID=UPI0039BFF7C8